MSKTFSTLTAAVLFTAAGALAQEATNGASTAGEIDATFTWTQVDYSTMPMGEGQEAYTAESFMVITAEGPLAGLAGRCLFMGVNDLATMGTQDAGTCVYQDADGNQLWERVEGMSEGNGAPYMAKATWIGGTGRFVGASGEITVEATFAASPRAGVYQGTGTKQGTLVLAGN